MIHSGAGGIGQSAINICKHYECDIYVTVGNEEKKRFIAEIFGIPEQNIFSSRDVNFKYRLLKLRNGQGVDVVINSLTGDKLVTSYEILGQCGRFIELGKLDMIKNNKLSMFNMLKDISFIAVGLDIAFIHIPNLRKEFFNWMHNNSTNGCVKPYNKIIFNSYEAEKAFRFMTTGRHIGKIIIKIREEENNRGPVMDIKPAKVMTVTKKTYFNPNKVFLIIGGLGGMGLELIHWMVSLGARKFLLTSRNRIKNDYQKFIIHRLQKFSENEDFEIFIKVIENDCLDFEKAEQLVRETEKYGKLSGIFHLGLNLNDNLIINMSYQQFCESIDCKFKVFRNLDILSRKLNYYLDYFVIFSSIVSGKGNAGQTNYAFGNSLCERVCEQRRKEGLHGLAIQYGAVGDVGVLENFNQIIDFANIKKQRINSCYDMLDRYLCDNWPIKTSWVIYLFHYYNRING